MSYPDDDMYPDAIKVTRPVVDDESTQDPDTGLSTLKDPETVVYDGACDAQDVSGKSGGTAYQSDSSDLQTRQADYLIMLPDYQKVTDFEIKDSIEITLSNGHKAYGSLSTIRNMDNSFEMEKS